MNFFSFVLALFLALAGACAEAQVPDALATAEAREDLLPKQELTGQILYQFLLAEIAAQRGQFGLSSSAYLDLATSTRDPRIVRRAAEIAFHARQYDAALDASRLWLTLEPASQEAKQMLSTLLLASGRIDELAVSLARDLAAEAPRTGDALMRLARIFARYPDKAAIRRLFEQLARPYPDLAEARLVLAQMAIGAGDGAAAHREIDRALELRPAWELAALFKAELLPKGTAQIDFLKTWLAVNPEAQEVRLGYARTLVAEKRYEASRVEFRRLLSANPDNPDMLYAVGILSLQVNDTAEAGQALKRFVELGRGDLDPARFYLGQIAEEAGRKPGVSTTPWPGTTWSQPANMRRRPRYGEPRYCCARTSLRRRASGLRRRAPARRGTLACWWPKRSCCAMPGCTPRRLLSSPRRWKFSRISPTSCTRRHWRRRSSAMWMCWSVICGA